MDLRVQDWVSGLFNFQPLSQFGVQQTQIQNFDGPPVECASFFAPTPKGFEGTSLAVVQNNFAVIPTDWINVGAVRPWFSAQGHSSLTECLTQFQDSSFIAFNDGFLSVIGKGATLEKAHLFSGIDAEHVHEAPVYYPATNELIFADTFVTGWLWALEVDKYMIRKIKTSPPLENVNGATIRGSRIYVTTNGGQAPAIWDCSAPTGVASSAPDAEPEMITCIQVVNNYRFNHLNSPNDLIFTSAGNILFTDPTYGWDQCWPGVGPPELPTATYHFNMATGALVTLDNDLMHMPNGLALSPDEKTLYVADSNSTSSRPVKVWDRSVRNVYAFDFDESKLTLRNRRLVHVVEAGWPDGLRVSVTKDGRELVLAAAMGGVDVLDVTGGGAGVLLGKWNVGDDIIFNLEPVVRAGQNRFKADTWLLTGKKGVYKVTLKSK